MLCWEVQETGKEISNMTLYTVAITIIQPPHHCKLGLFAKLYKLSTVRKKYNHTRTIEITSGFPRFNTKCQRVVQKVKGRDHHLIHIKDTKR